MAYFSIRNLLALILISVAAPVSAQTLDAESIEALERFYHQFNGDEWHNNESWLNHNIPACEWQGIDCRDHDGDGVGVLRALKLPDNNLSGRWDESDITAWVEKDLDLSGNEISGRFQEVPCQLRKVDLSDNQLSGSLPEKNNTVPCEISSLDLARNQLEGPAPASWQAYAINIVDLSGNRLSGNANHLTLAARQHINLADNAFSGDLADLRYDHLLEKTGESSWGGAINLCWNELDSEDEQVIADLAEYHMAGEDLVGCLKRERTPLSPEVSGSWFDPGRSGEGVAVQLLANGDSLHYTFGFDNQSRQHWLVGTGPTTKFTLHWPYVSSLRGTFGDGMVEQPDWPIPYPSAGGGRNWRMDRTGEHQFRIQRNYRDCSDCPEPVQHPIFLVSQGDQINYVRLSSVAGTRCDNQQPHQWVSGTWYDPQRSGEGFLVEVLEDGTGLVYWFTYRSDDSMHQAWMIGMGEFEGQTLVIDDLIQPTGGAWGDNFNPEAVELEHWGALRLEFSDQNSGHAYWDSVKSDYGSGDHPIQRLSHVRLADCGES